MSAIKYLKHLHLAYLSKPAGDRPIFQAIRKCHPTRIVELGMGSGERTERLLGMASELVDSKIHYTGADLFEGRPDPSTGMTLKDAHRRFSNDRVKSRLAPGDVLSVVTRMANSLADTDLLLISGEHEPQLLEAAWYYVPRMLHETSIVLLEQGKGAQAAYQLVTTAEIDRMAATAYRPTRAAA